jgi:hypothetical protein
MNEEEIQVISKRTSHPSRKTGTDKQGSFKG